MSTKILYQALYALMALSVIGSTVLIFLMPDQVPVHFGIAGEVDRIGSRYENFILPALCVAFGVLIALMAKYGDPSNESVLLKLGIGVQACMIGIAAFLFSNAVAFHGTVPDAPASGFDISRVTAIGGGILVVIMSNLMPKASSNAAFGLRTPWSRSSEENWRVSQRIGAYTGIVAGLAMIVSGFVLPDGFATYAVLGLLLAWLAASMLASYLVYRKNGA